MGSLIQMNSHVQKEGGGGKPEFTYAITVIGTQTCQGG